MEINNYLYIILILMMFYCAIIIYLKMQYSSFTPVDSGIPAIESKPNPIYIQEQPDVYLTEDTRMQYPLLPPVNPMARNRIISSDIPAERDLFNNQEYGTQYYVLDTPGADNTNQLLSSSGQLEMIKIPLQINEPFNEQLRSQDILVTPYNKVKYGTC